MYQSLYRKYRPASFDDVIGQEIPVKILKNAIVNNRIAHAYLFAGIRGTGKTSIAKIFAKTVNCLQPDDCKPCNKCVVCTQNNTDIVEIDAASNNGVDEIRDLRDKISLVPSISKYKVYIIDEVHMLSASAFNALLKTLEEPPSHAIFILATTEAYKIPSTILSRCQRLDFKAISIENIILRLKYICEKEKIKISDSAVAEIARIANGGMRDAISLLEQVWAYSDNIEVDDVHKMNGTLGREETKKLLHAIVDSDIQKCFSLINEYSELGVDFAKLIEELIYFLHNLVILKNSAEFTDNLYLRSDYEEFENLITTERIIELIKKFNTSSNEARTVSNKKLIFEMMIINSMEETGRPKEVIVREKKNVEPSKAVVNPKYVEKVKNEFLKSLPKEEKDEKDEKEENNFDEEIKKIKETRVGNTLAEFSKRTLTTLQKKMEKLKDYAVDLEYNEFASILLDGKLKAASSEYMLYVYEEEIVVQKFMTKIEMIESLIKIITGNDYYVIAINNSEWEVIKEEFNNKKKTFEKVEETEEFKKTIKKIAKKQGDFIDDNFSDIISYE